VRILSPADRPVPKFPRWPLYLIGPALVFSALSKVSSAFQSIALFATFAGVVGVWVYATRAEERVHLWARSRSAIASLVIAGLVPLVGLFATGIAGAIAGGLLGWAFGGTGIALVTFGGLWFVGAAMGSFVIVVIDVVVSKAVAGFRARLTAAILCMLGLSFLVALGGSVAALELIDVLRQGASSPHIRFDGDPDQAVRILDWITHHPIAVACIVYGTAGLLGSPAALSASSKLAEAVMDRIHPLTGAFDAISRGDRDVRVEEGGSRDFVLLSKRFNQMVDGLSRAERMERAFGSYVSAPLLERIRAQHGEAVVPASLRDATVFFADIRGFTAMSEKHPPEVVVSILNRYFGEVIKLVADHQGYLNKFIGDAVVVVFNGPIDQADHAERATRCAMALQALVARLNEAGAFPEVGSLSVGVGVSTGPMVCGNIGSTQQMEYTVIGDTVNLAARLTSKAGKSEVWISERTVAALPEDIKCTALEPVEMKGKSEPVVPYRVDFADLPPSLRGRKDLVSSKAAETEI
jgi:class 3 adenylate cyclase